MAHNQLAVVINLLTRSAADIWHSIVSHCHWHGLACHVL